MKNKYYNRSRISEAKFMEVVQYFSLDIDATKTAEITHLNRNTILLYFEGHTKWYIRSDTLCDLRVYSLIFIYKIISL